jgi:outer membrane lipoprotein-sorting protein
VAVAAVIGLGAWIPTLPASASPQLPAQSVDQLIARAEQPSVAGFSGSFEWTANLGLPSLSGITSATGGSDGAGISWTDLLSGSHQVKVWDGGTNGERVALIEPASEYDLYVSSEATGNQTWAYDSSSNTATHLVPGRARRSRPAAPSQEPALTPQQVAARILRQVEGVTTLSVSPATYVGGQPAYILSLVPKSTAGGADSTIGNISLAIDASNGSVLRVSVTPVGSKTAALSVGFTSVTFDSASHLLPASDFAFTPPSGAKVTTQELGIPMGGRRKGMGDHARPTVLGSGWDTTVVIPGAGAALSGAASSATRTVMPPAAMPASPHRHRWMRHSVVSNPRSIDAVTTQVTGSFGTARLLHTSLLNALILPDGTVIAGFVTPQALEAAASSHSAAVTTSGWTGYAPMAGAPQAG